MKTFVITLVLIILLIPCIRLLNRLIGIVREKTKPRLYRNPALPFYNWQDEALDNEGRFPWSNVLVSKYIGPSLPFEPNLGIKPCPKCIEGGKVEPADTLVWVYFRSPEWTWRNKWGRAGYLSICTEHKRQVDFICTMMN